MTAPVTPPPGIHTAALALAVRITGIELEDNSDSPGARWRTALFELFQAFASAIVDEASRRATPSTVDAVMKERRRDLLETTVVLDAPPPPPTAEQEIERLRARVAELEDHIRELEAALVETRGALELARSRGARIRELEAAVEEARAGLEKPFTFNDFTHARAALDRVLEVEPREGPPAS